MTGTTWAADDLPDDLANATEATLGRRAVEASPSSVAESIGSVEFVQEEPNPPIDALRDGVSTFALDVDTGSYTIGKRFVEDGYLPDRASVRTEECVNALNYHYSQPRSGDDFAIHLMGGVTPFVAEPRAFLFQVGLQAFDVSDEDRPEANLAFVVDVSGSMSQARKDWRDVLVAAEYPRQAAYAHHNDGVKTVTDETERELAKWLDGQTERLVIGRFWHPWR